MKKYVGKYRVCCEWDMNKLVPLKESTYIYCSGEGQIYRVNDDTLGYLKPKRGVMKSYIDKFKDLEVEITHTFDSEGDICFWFNEKDLDKVSEYLGARKSGVNISPYSKRNLKLFKWYKENYKDYVKRGLVVELTEEEKQVYRDRFNKNIKND